MANPLTADQLNTIAKQTGYNPVGGSFSSIGLPTSTPPPVPTPSTINSQNMSSTSPIPLPTSKPDTTNYTGYIANGNAMTTANGALFTIPSGAQVDTKTPPSTTLSDTNQPNAIQTYLQGLMGIQPPSATDISNKLYNSSNITGLQSDFNTKQQNLLNAQSDLATSNTKLQGINAEATAIPIAMQQQSVGRGITEAGLAPIQADQLRANALKAIPIQTEVLANQAKVAAAQGNAQLSQSILQQAQDHLDKVFQISMTDANTKYQYQTNLIDKVYQYADKQQQTKLDAQKATLASNNTQYNNFVNDVRQISATAVSSGQSNIASQITQLIGNLNPNSKTFSSDFAKVNQQVSQLQGKIAVAQKTPTVTPNSPGSTADLSAYTPVQQQKFKSIGLSPIQAENALGIANGQRPPLTGFGMNSKEGQAVTAGALALGYDMVKASNDWTAIQKRLSTLNGSQQIRLQQAVSFTSDSLDIIDQLNLQWQGGKFPILNKASLVLAKNGVYGADAQSLATRFDAQINDLISELGTVYKGGNSSTDESLKLAAGNLSSNWSQKTLTDAVNLARTNLQIRKNSIANSSVIEGNQYSTGTTAPTADQHNSYQDYLKAIGL